jgi:hypothetical protein
MEGNIIINSVGLKGIQDGVRGMKVAWKETLVSVNNQRERICYFG